jgi:uncharacterized membrane protein
MRGGVSVGSVVLAAVVLGALAEATRLLEVGPTLLLAATALAVPTILTVGRAVADQRAVHRLAGVAGATGIAAWLAASALRPESPCSQPWASCLVVLGLGWLWAFALAVFRPPPPPDVRDRVAI